MARPVRPIAMTLVVLMGLVLTAYLPDRLPNARAQFAPLAQNDAGSGQDAGNTPFDALLMASTTRTYAGNLSPAGTDVDWFRHEPEGAFCSEVETTLSTAGQVTLAADAILETSTSRSARPQAPTRLALAGPAGGMPFLGIEPAPTLASTGDTPTNPGRYTFRFVTRGLMDLDPEGNGESPEAGATLATAAPVPGSCFAGRLAASDAADRYVFDVDAPQELTVSMAVARGREDVRLVLVSPSGAARATISSGQSAGAFASETGRWSLVVERTGGGSGASTAAALLPLLAARSSATLLEDTDYIVGLSTGPGSDPCRPSC